MYKKSALTEASDAAATLRPGGAPGEPRAKQLTQIVDMLANMSDEDINKFKETIAQVGHEADSIPGGAAAANLASITPKASAAVTSEAYAQDVADLFGSEEISEEFKDRALTIFESAVNLRVSLIEAELRDAAEEAITEAVEMMEAELTEALDKYLDYVAEQYIENNQEAIQGALRVEQATSFMEGLRNLFVEHNIHVPEGAEDVVEQLEAEIAELNARLDEAVNENIELTSILDEQLQNDIFHDVAEGLALTQADKFRKLTEGIEFDDPDSFRDRLLMIKEHHFGTPKRAKSTNLIVEEREFGGVDELVEEVTPVGGGDDVSSRYLPALEKLSKK